MKIAILLLLILALIGCSSRSSLSQKPVPADDPPPPLGKLVRCGECDGKGEVVYDENHFLVIHGLSEPGTYTCPMCNGFGELVEEVRE